jgi:hypothetical protein
LTMALPKAYSILAHARSFFFKLIGSPQRDISDEV